MISWAHHAMAFSRAEADRNIQSMYYEEVLIVPSYPEIIRSQALPEECSMRRRYGDQRYRFDRGFESHLLSQGNRVVKIFLQRSKDEQTGRF